MPRSARENPRIVLCSISGYGQDGPYAARAGHDLDYCALAGVLGADGDARAPGRRSACRSRTSPAARGRRWRASSRRSSGARRTGEGAHVDVSMTEGALALLALPLGDGVGARDAARARAGARSTAAPPATACTGRRTAASSRSARSSPSSSRAFCAAVGRPELARAPARGRRRGPGAELEAIFAARTRDEWAAFAAAHDVCLAPVLEGDEPRRGPAARARAARSWTCRLR